MFVIYKELSYECYKFDSHTLKIGDDLSSFQVRKLSLTEVEICLNSVVRAGGNM